MIHYNEVGVMLVFAAGGVDAKHSGAVGMYPEGYF